MPHQCTSCTETFPDGSKEMLSGCPRCGGNTFQYLPDGQLDDPPDESPPERPEPPGMDSAVTETVGKAATTVREYVSRSGSGSPPSRADQPAADTDGGDSEPDIRTPSPAADPARSEETGTAADSGPASQSEPGDEFEPAVTDTGSPTGSEDMDDAAMVSADTPGGEDTAQASARNEIADLSDLPDDAGPAEERPEPPRSDAKVVKQPDEPDRPDLDTLRQELNDQFESIKILEPGQYELNLMGLYDREEHIIALQEDGKYVIEVPEKWRSERSPETED